MLSIKENFFLNFSPINLTSIEIGTNFAKKFQDQNL